MARKPGVPYIPGTEILDLGKFRSDKRMRKIVGAEPNFSIIDDIKADWVHAEWRPYDGPLDIQGHHGRMITATEALKRLDALRDKGRWERR
jgi:hypothetical protein